MSKFIIEYWQFFVAGLILLALVAYWVTDRVLANKAKEKELKKMEALLEESQEEKPAEKTAEEPVAKKSKKQPIKEEKKEDVLEQTEKADTQETEPTAKQEGVYTISYDKEKKDWVVKKHGNQRATKRTRTKKEALDAVKELTENQNTGYVVKKKDGKIQKK